MFDLYSMLLFAAMRFVEILSHCEICITVLAWLAIESFEAIV
jgi:hypothetical protein